MPKLQFLGGGKMAEALLAGLIGDGWARAGEIVVVERYEPRRLELTDRFSELDVRSFPAADVATVIAVKPQDIGDAVGALDGLQPTRVLSIAAGITIAQLEAGLDHETAVVRCMPNTPALVGKGASAIAGGSKAGVSDLDWAESVLSAVGIVERVSETDLDAVTGLSGSGPAYVFLLAEELANAGVAAGLDSGVAKRLAYRTVSGAGALLEASDEDAEVLRSNVTSPGGTTAAGIASLQTHEFEHLIEAAVAAATARSVELGQQR